MIYFQNKKTQDGHKVRNESEANINIDTKEKKCEFMPKEEPMDIKTESMDTDYGTSSEVGYICYLSDCYY